MMKFSWYTIPERMTKLETVYQYAVDRFIPYRIDKSGFGSYIHIKKGTFVVHEDGGCKRYKPNMKGGHRHNHIYNVCHKHVFRSKLSRKNIDREDKKEFVRVFYLGLRLNHNFGEFLHKIFHKNNRSTAQ